MNKFFHVEYFARVAREAANSLKAYSEAWFYRHPLRPPVFERQQGKCDSNAFYCIELSFSVMVRIVWIHVNWFLVVAEHLETVAGDSADSVTEAEADRLTGRNVVQAYYQRMRSAYYTRREVQDAHVRYATTGHICLSQTSFVFGFFLQYRQVDWQRLIITVKGKQSLNAWRFLF